MTGKFKYAEDKSDSKLIFKYIENKHHTTIISEIPVFIKKHYCHATEKLGITEKNSETTSTFVFVDKIQISGSQLQNIKLTQLRKFTKKK